MEVDVQGNTAYVATGNRHFDPSRETVVFVHGVAQDHTIWVLPNRYFARHHRNVLAVDLPGHGRSGGSPLETIEEMGQWIIDVMDAVGVEKAAIVGHSMGSLVALEVAAGNPDRVRSLAMIGVSIPIAVSEPLMSSAKTHSHEALDMMTYWSHSKVAQIGGSPTPGMWMVGGGLRLLEQTDPVTVHSDLSACDIYVTGIDRAREIGCPTLLLLGAKDQMTPTRVAQTLRETISDSNTVVFEDAGHALLTERPDPVLDQLIRIV